MSRTKKILLFSGAAVLFLLLAVVVLVHLLITPERVKGWALPVLEETLQREVHLAEVNIGLLSGIALHDLQIRDKDGKNNLLQIQDLLLSYQFMPLLSGRLVVDDVQLIGPRIRLVQNADGSMNIDDLLSGSKAEEKAPTTAADPTASDKKIDLLVSRVLLEGGDFLLVRGVGGSEDIHVQDIHALAKNITLDKPFPFELSVRMKETEFRVEGEFQPSANRGRLDLFVKRLDLNRFIPVTPEAGTSKPKSETKAVPTEEPGPIEVPITLAGSVQIDELLYQDLVVKTVRAEYQLADNRFQLSQLTGTIADGQFKLKAGIDLGQKGFVYKGDCALQGVNLQSLVPALVPQAEKSVHGLVQLQFDFYGTGTDPERLLKKLKSKGSFELGQGKLTGSPLLTGLAKFLGNPELKVLSFQSLTGQYALSQGLAQTKVALDSAKTRIDSSGTVDLDGRIDLELNTRLAPEILHGSTNSSIGRAFTDADGWGVLPLKIAGTYNDPKFSLNSKGLQSQLKEKAKEKLEEKLQEKMGEDLAPAKELIDNSLKKLFGK